MKKVLLWILGVLVVLVVAILAFAATKPDTFHVERTATINAPPEKIFALINDFHRWESWSPYERRDPAMNRIHRGAVSGSGAVYEWDGNSDVGAGRMEILEATSPSKITIRLNFMRPFENESTAEFTLEPTDSSTNITWAMHGPNLYIGKVLSVFFSMDGMVGKDFEAGLSNLKSLTEE